VQAKSCKFPTIKAIDRAGIEYFINNEVSSDGITYQDVRDNIIMPADFIWDLGNKAEDELMRN